MDEPTLDNLEVAAADRILTDTLTLLLACLDGLDPDQLNWRPPVEGGNSVYILAVHTVANVEESVIEVLGGEPVGRIREQEFVAQGDSADALHARWAALQPRLRAALAALTPADLAQEYRHPRRGPMSGRDVLLRVVRHAAEHLGHAELTRDWIKAGGSRE
jgi:hypothetical protein